MLPHPHRRLLLQLPFTCFLQLQQIMPRRPLLQLPLLPQQQQFKNQTHPPAKCQMKGRLLPSLRQPPKWGWTLLNRSHQLLPVKRKTRSQVKHFREGRNSRRKVIDLTILCFISCRDNERRRQIETNAFGVELSKLKPGR